MPDLHSLHGVLLYVPLSVIGLWRWSYWLVRRLGAAAYRPRHEPWPPGEPRPTVSVVTPVYNEDPVLFAEALRSWGRNGVDEVVAVIDAANTSHVVRYQRHFVDRHGAERRGRTRFRLVVTPKPGKRAALCDGIEQSTGDVVVLVDSDTVWDDDVLEKTLPAFRDPRVGGATVAQRISNPTTVGNVLFDILLWTRYREEVPFLLGVGRVFNTLSGRTAFYRREALLSPEHDNMHDLRHEFFLGARAVSGDDKRLSHLVIRQGWETAFVRGTTVRTPGLGSLRSFFKQRLRWTRNSWRADLKAVASGWVFRHPALALFMIDRFVQPVLMLVGPVVLVVAVAHREWLFVGVLLTWWLVSRFVRVFGYFWQHPSALRHLPAYTVYGYVNAVLKIYAVATLMENTWATRWAAHRTARRSRARRIRTITQGAVALAACTLLLVQLAMSFRQQVAADVRAQPVYDAARLHADVERHRDLQAAPPTPSTAGVEVKTYVVRPGDSLDVVAARLGADRDAIKRMNGITDGDLISVGQRLSYVPAEVSS